MSISLPKIICGKTVEKLWKTQQGIDGKTNKKTCTFSDDDDESAESVVGIGTATGHRPRARVSDSDSECARVARSGFSPWSTVESPAGGYRVDGLPR
jgi:hypothetical protein